MTLQQMKNVVVLEQTANMRRAAEQLFISEPALSMSIAKLEEELKVPLFDRKGRSISATEAGRAFVEHAVKILRETEETVRHMESFSDAAHRKIRIGYVTPLASHFMPEKMRQFLDKYGRNIEFEIESGETKGLVRGLKNGVYDMILCSDPGEVEGIVKYELLRQRLMLISSPQSPLEVESFAELGKKVKEGTVNLIGYSRGGSMDTYLSVLQAKERVPLTFSGRAPDEAAIASMVMQNLGCALVAAVDDLERFEHLHRQLINCTSGRYIYLITLTGTSLSAAPELFRKFLINVDKPVAQD